MNNTLLKNQLYWNREVRRIGLYETLIDILEESMVVVAVMAVGQWILVFKYIYWWAAAIATGILFVVAGVCMILRGIILVRLSRAVEHTHE
jgi:hypothetical protein